MLATLLRTHRLRLVSDAEVVPRRRGLTMGPVNGIPMICDGTRPLASTTIGSDRLTA